jgi:nucleotide-binding universal stress UspA family protein
MSTAHPVKLSPMSAAFTISLALSQTYALRHGEPEAKRRWATVPALNILQTLEASYIIGAQLPRDDLVSIIVDELVKAPPRPSGHWTKREAWRQDVALQIADALAAVATIRGKPPSADFQLSTMEPTWR